jgi:hypothetical protein
VGNVNANKPNYILFVEPQLPKSTNPLIDVYTRKMTAAILQSVEHGGQGRICRCGAIGLDRDLRLPNGMTTNSLSVHYLAYHRAEVPLIELNKVAELNFGEVEPHVGQLDPTVGSDPLSRTKKET